ncbi:MAG TPA: HemK2/MTQ2 family protein methyltransferase [Candidatus Nitrosocosmicus sp.]|nr:HemK2/MTQ2 family protein methyltransferase [Candidatus Nitrosocosmicus sp.]
MYKPAEDTFLMEDTIKNYRGNFALEIGIGSGYLTRKLCSNFAFVIGTDLDFNSIVYAKNNTLLANSNKLLVCTDLGSALNFKFDLIISNPPYLPKDTLQGFEDNTMYGGTEGIELTLRILESAKPLLHDNGKILLSRSSLSNLQKMDDFIDRLFFKKRVLVRKNLFFEFLEIIELAGVRNTSSHE